jgi:hypothetical protein
MTIIATIKTTETMVTAGIKKGKKIMAKETEIIN